MLIVDDLLATGGTIEATTKLIRRLGATTTDSAFIISLPDLGGEIKLKRWVYLLHLCCSMRVSKKLLL